MGVTTSILLFVIALLALAVQRIIEMRLSQKNAAHLLTSGGIELDPWQASAMKIIHTAWFVSMVLEVILLHRVFEMWMLWNLILFGFGQFLRYHAITTLKNRWCIRVIVLPGNPPVSKGLYSWIKHPNYLGVILELFSFPMLHGAFLTAGVFTILNGLLLAFRIRTENRALYPG